MTETRAKDTPPEVVEQWQAAHDAGQKAFRDHVRYTQNPYRDPDLRDRWADGWLEAENDAHRQIERRKR